jgi:hypothetical protein
VAIAPCSSAYLVCLIADRDAQVGMLKNRALHLARRLAGLLEAVAPKTCQD